MGRWEYGGGGCRCALRKGRGGGKEGDFFPSVFVFVFCVSFFYIKKKKSFNEHVKVFTMFCIY